MSRTSTTPTTSTNHPNPKSSINVRIPSHSKHSSYNEYQENDTNTSMRPKTAPTTTRSNSVNEKKGPGKEIVPKSNSQRQQQRPRSSMNLRSNRNKEYNSSSTSMEKQPYTINPNVTSKLRQNRNYQPPRRKTRQRSSSSQGR